MMAHLLKKEGECKMDVEILELSDRNAKFIISGISPAFANSLRKSMLAEVPVMAIDEIQIYTNTSFLFDEQLGLRMGLIPIKTDTSLFNLPEKCSCEGKGCSSCEVSMTLNIEGPKTVYSRDIVSDSPDIYPVDKNIPTVELKKNHKLIIVCIARLGIGRKHAKWQAGISCGYKNLPILNIQGCDGCGRCVEACPRGILRIRDDIVEVTDILDCSMCKLCEKECETESIKVGESQDTFIMNMETTGSWKAFDFVIEAAKTIKDKAKELDEILNNFS